MAYKFTESKVQLPKHDTDVTVLLPDGTRVVLQWRVDSLSLDVCFEKETTVTVWKDIDMTPAKLNRQGFTNAMQLVFSFPESVLGE